MYPILPITIHITICMIVDYFHGPKMPPPGCGGCLICPYDAHYEAVS